MRGHKSLPERHRSAACRSALCEEVDAVTESHEPAASNSPADAAALLGVIIGAVLTMAGQPGPWYLLSSIIGLCLGLVLVAFVRLPTADHAWQVGRFLVWRKAAAISAVGAFVVCLTLAWVLQRTVVRWLSNTSGLSPVQAVQHVADNTTTTAFPILWLGSAIGLYLIIRQRVRHAEVVEVHATPA